MVTPVKLALAGLLFVASARAEFSFTPTVSEYEGDGVKFKQLVFSDGSGKDITYSPPMKWEYSGSAARLTLRPPHTAQAEAALTKITLPQPGVFDEAGMKKLVEDALASVPNGSTGVALISQEKNPVMIEGKETVLVTVSYIFAGDNLMRSILFLNRGKEQMRFQLVSRKADFPELQRAFLGSHFSWQNL